MTINRGKAYPIVIVANLFAVSVRMYVFPELGWLFHLLSLTTGIITAPLLLEGSVWLHNKLNAVMPYTVHSFSPDFRIVRRMGVQVLICMLVFATFGGLMFWLYGGYIPLTIKLPMLSKPFIVAAILTGNLFVVTINLALFGKEFFDNWKTELLRNERLQKERAEAQFESLKNQLNPHFLFNALTSLSSLIQDNPTLANDYVQQLSKVYRYVLQSREKEFVTLDTEVKFIANYFRLLKTRFQEGLFIEIAISDEALERLIVPVTLQTLVENAIKHNVINPQNPLQIKVCSEMLESAYYLVVENSLQKRTLVETSNKQGLARLQALYEHLSKHRIFIEETSEKFAVKVPLL
jgi:two-component system LytT family sensor kinase